MTMALRLGVRAAETMTHKEPLQYIWLRSEKAMSRRHLQPGAAAADRELKLLPDDREGQTHRGDAGGKANPSFEPSTKLKRARQLRGTYAIGTLRSSPMREGQKTLFRNFEM